MVCFPPYYLILLLLLGLFAGLLFFPRTNETFTAAAMTPRPGWRCYLNGRLSRSAAVCLAVVTLDICWSIMMLCMYVNFFTFLFLLRWFVIPLLLLWSLARRHRVIFLIAYIHILLQWYCCCWSKLSLQGVLARPRLLQSSKAGGNWWWCCSLVGLTCEALSIYKYIHDDNDVCVRVLCYYPVTW